MEYSTKGKHFIADIWVEGELPDFDNLVKELVKACSLNIADQLIKDFEPYGETRLYLLTESHLAIHTYPEHGYFSLDIYTCGEEGQPENGYKILAGIPNVKTIKTNNLTRG